MDNGYVLLVEKEEMWARMLLHVLEDHGIPCTALPVYGAGFVMRTGMQDRLQVFVPAEQLAQASELVQELFAAELVQEDAEIDPEL